MALLNLMPNKPVTDRQFATLLARCGRPVDLVRFLPDGYRPHTTSPEYLAIHYAPWAEVRDRPIEGLIVTGAPIEHLPFREVDYWASFTRILDWTQARGIALMTICWSAQAALHHFHGVDKHALPEKLFGIFDQAVRQPDSPLLTGLGRRFPTPVSRHTTVDAAELAAVPGLEILADNRRSGPGLVDEPERAATYMFNHLEYEAGTLDAEYRRDLAAGRPIRMPEHYYPRDNFTRPPSAHWAPFGERLFANWLDRLLLRRRQDFAAIARAEAAE